MDVNENSYHHKHTWKRRFRNAPSAKASDYEILLKVLWNPIGQKERPRATDLKDPLLWAIWLMGSGMIFCVMSGLDVTRYFVSKKDALAEYKRRVKEFPRSKEVDYLFPVDEAIPE